eukprot:TRINITY_DN2235_c0_g1_i5.p1 TRINITY_DN2235_c0_g1~~TRINITY_DN2235_c0_g1_i5.p1  ORF type:complete len:621 (-),score=107.56 TRINITY_DN2235_c0_g1_i5:96-1958(-)
MAESEQVAAPLGASPAASPVPADRRPAPPPRRAVSARLTPLNTIVAANPSSVDDSSPVQSPAFGRPRLPGAVGTATPSNPSTPVTTPHSPAIQDIPSRPFTPPADPGSNPGSAPASPSTIRLQNRHSMMNMMKEVRKINTAPTPPVGHVRPLELPIPKPPPSNLPKSVTDDDATEKIAALAQAYRVKEDELEAARRIFQKLDVNGDGLISFNDFVRFKFDPVHKDLQGRVASYFGSAPTPSTPNAAGASQGTPTISRSVSAFVTPVSSRTPSESSTSVELPVRKTEASPPVATQSLASPSPAPSTVAPVALPMTPDRAPVRLPIANATTQPASENPNPRMSPRSPRLPGPVSPRSASQSTGAAPNAGIALPKRPAAMSNGGTSPKGPPPTPAPAPTSYGPPVPQGGPPPSQSGPPVPQGGPPVQGGPPKSTPPPTPSPAPPKLAGPPPPSASPTPTSFNASYGPPPPSRAQPATPVSPHLAGIQSALAGMDLPDTPREDEEPETQVAPSTQDGPQKGISFRGVDWDKVNAAPDEHSDDENKLDDWDKPRDDPDDVAPAAESADAGSQSSTSESDSADGRNDKASKRMSAQRIFSGARSRSSKMLSGLVNKLNGGTKNSPK